MKREAAKFSSGQVVGWLTLRQQYWKERKPGSSGERWVAMCKCLHPHDVSRESLVNGRVRACLKCAKAYRAQEDEGIR
jgi:hypothetical protein